ncbi:Ras-related protein RabJ [Tritrichomonas foetus]|uniref:Ras-related protein RabJ n=1 Tax=Tritrichomonas foetus TaxID=1144522 RepID=A0A1J4JZB7_9EUKA|nr:Ras-related protein RabJ [Tritrichomonas foetus]|eukprot:OHT03832.1 Ras-related protein RabJ [Tritrichomonas foetus]
MITYIILFSLLYKHFLYDGRPFYNFLNGRHMTNAIKAILCGNTTVGKTTLLHALTGSNDPLDSSPTLGAGFASVTENFNGQDVSFNIWDTAGQETYRSLIKIYFRGSQLAILVFDISNRSSFEALQSWIDEIRENSSDSCPIVIVANKVDLPNRQVKFEEIATFANDRKLVFVECLAAQGEGINKLLNIAYRAYLGEYNQEKAQPAKSQDKNEKTDKKDEKEKDIEATPKSSKMQTEEAKDEQPKIVDIGGDENKNNKKKECC